MNSAVGACAQSLVAQLSARASTRYGTCICSRATCVYVWHAQAAWCVHAAQLHVRERACTPCVGSTAGRCTRTYSIAKRARGCCAHRRGVVHVQHSHMHTLAHVHEQARVHTHSPAKGTRTCVPVHSVVGTQSHSTAGVCAIAGARAPVCLQLQPRSAWHHARSPPLRSALGCGHSRTPGPAARLSPPRPAGSTASSLADHWLARLGGSAWDTAASRPSATRSSPPGTPDATDAPEKGDAEHPLPTPAPWLCSQILPLIFFFVVFF